MLLHRQKIITKNNKGLSLPIQSLSDYSSLPESENIFSNSSFVSKKILDVIIYVTQSVIILHADLVKRQLANN